MSGGGGGKGEWEIGIEFGKLCVLLEKSLLHPCRESIACTETMFYFSFRSFRKHRRARENERRGRERNLSSSSPTTTPLRWRSINPLRFIFYHPGSTDFEEKIKAREQARESTSSIFAFCRILITFKLKTDCSH